MDNELWSIFSRTGDPVCYLLYKASEKQKDKDGKAEDAKCQPSGQNTAWT
jgi:hypothetical protein